MLQISRALRTTSSVTPSKISLGEGTGGTRTLTITNRGSSAVTYTPSHVGSIGTGPNTFAVSFFGPAGTASFRRRTSRPGRGTATVDVTIGVNPALADKSLYAATSS